MADLREYVGMRSRRFGRWSWAVYVEWRTYVGPEDEPPWFGPYPAMETGPFDGVTLRRAHRKAWRWATRNCVGVA